MGRRDAVLQNVGEQLEQVHQLDLAAVLQKKASFPFVVFFLGGWRGKRNEEKRYVQRVFVNDDHGERAFSVFVKFVAVSLVLRSFITNV